MTLLLQYPLSVISIFLFFMYICAVTNQTMSSGPGVISKILLFFFMAQTESKLFLAETENFPTNKLATGEDYLIGPGGAFFDINSCNDGCTVNCTEDKSVTYSFGIKVYRCFISPFELNIKPNEPTTTVEPTTSKPETTTAQEGCLKSPRNHKRTSRMKKNRTRLRKKGEPLGFFVTKAGTVAGKSFCCNQGRRSGELVKYQRGCKTPREQTG